MIRRLLPLVGVIFALTAAHPAQASTSGLKATGYIIDEIPPVKSDTAYPTCGTETENNINRSYDGEPFQQCPDDGFMVHYEGFITIPAHNTIQFWLAADDGGTIKIGLDEFGTWDDKGCSATESGYLNLEAESVPLDAWFYENGGGTCFMLAWNINDEGWSIVPDEAFTSQAVATTSTTSTSTTTTSTTSTTTTSTTVAPVATTTTSTTSTSTTSTSTTSSSTTTSSTTTVPKTTTTVAKTTTTTETPQTSTTSTTAAPIAATTTVQQTTSTISSTTVPPSSTSSTSSTTPTTTSTLTNPETTSTTTIPQATARKTETIDPQVLALITEVAALPPAQIQAKVADIISSGVNNSEAQLLATSPAILENISADTAATIFEAITESELTPSEGEEIVNALLNATTSVKKAFEEAINVFGGAVDTYVPVGSRVPVSSRRIIIITAGILVALPSPTRKFK
jgi:hypothetical protein